MSRTAPFQSPTHELSSRPKPIAAPPPQIIQEPFGQAGVLRFVRPMLQIMVTCICVISACLWYRSYNLSDSFSVWPIDQYGWTTNSIYGRIVFNRFLLSREYPDSPAVPGGTIRTSYTTSLVPETIVDAWQPSWLKTLGIEWRHVSVPLALRGHFSDFWLRIRWRTITLVSAIWPVMGVLHHHLTLRRSRLRPDVA